MLRKELDDCGLSRLGQQMIDDMSIAAQMGKAHSTLGMESAVEQARHQLGGATLASELMQVSEVRRYVQAQNELLKSATSVRGITEDLSLASATQYASSFDAQLQQREDYIQRFRESVAWDNTVAATRWAEDAKRIAQARAWAQPSLAAIAAMQLLGTNSIRSAVDALRESSAIQTALNALDSPEDLIARVSGVASMARLQEQIMGWHETTVPAWSEAARLFQVVDWEAILTGDEAEEEGRTEPGKAHSSTESPLPSGWQRLSRGERLFLILYLITQMFGDNWLPRLEEHFRSLPPAEVEQHSPTPATTRDWATLAASTPLLAEPEAGAETLLTLQAGAWVRVLDDKPGWLLIEAETGQATKVTGWIRNHASQRWNERLFEEAFQQLQAALPATEAALHRNQPSKDAVTVPALVAEAGTAAGQRYVEYFTASLRNRNTRAAYWHACNQFLGRCHEAGLTLDAIQPVHVAGYIEHLSQSASAPTVKQHLAAIRRMFDFLVVGQILPTNPAASVRGPKHVVSEGKTPILDAEEVRQLFAQFDESRLADLRDRAILGTMVYGFARVGALVKLRVKDYYRQGTRAWFLLSEKGGKQNRVPTHHQAAEFIEQYIVKAGIDLKRETPLFRSLGRGRGGKTVTERGLRREEVFAMVKRRTSAAGLPSEIGCHSFRGTGITNYLKNGGTIETAAKLAGHASTRTTQLYDRRLAEVAQTEVERIRF